jgi:Zn-dependent protease
LFENIPPFPILLAQILVLFLAIGLHEYAHCKTADMAGDPTPRFYGRVTLNLTKHFEPMGTLMMIISSLSGFGIGWGRASPINPAKMHNPRWDTFVSVAAGPISNILQAMVYALLIRIVVATGALGSEGASPAQVFFQTFLLLGVVTNLALAIFNLIPFGPLDGHWIVGLLLPPRLQLPWFRFNRQVGLTGVFILVIALQWSHIPLTRGPIEFGFKLLTGISL